MAHRARIPYPAVRVELRLLRRAPALPLRESIMDIWLSGSRFRVRDRAAREFAAIEADLVAGRGLGAPVRSMEAIMDVWSESQMRPDSAQATELYGDLTTNQGWVRRNVQEAWPIAAERLAPIAEQILAGVPEKYLKPHGQSVHLGRQCADYQGFLKGKEQGVSYKSAVTQSVSSPYLMLSDVRDATNTEHYYVREIVTLEEGAVDDADLRPQ